jgi:hypothetical protein
MSTICQRSAKAKLSNWSVGVSMYSRNKLDIDDTSVS